MKALLTVCRDELRRIFALRPVFSTLVLAPLLYAVFYPQPYVNEALRDVPIAVVDRDGTTSSRELARRVDATSDVAVALVLPDLQSAERAVQARTVSGILLIPQYFERDLLHGRRSPVALYADASYFLIYQRVAGGVGAVARTMGAEVEAARLIGIGVDPAIATAAVDPMPLTAVTLFNPQGGYATYLLPAAFVLLVQQLLLMGVGLLGTLGGRGAETAAVGPVATVMGKMLAYLALEAVVLPFYLVVLPYLYDVPRLGSVGAILLLAVPFVLSVAGLGMVVAAIFRSSLAVQLALAAVGLPFFFLSGFSWPSEAIPEAVRLISLLVPSSSAIDAFVSVSQLGASLAEMRPQFLTLWALAAVYGGVAMALEAWRRRPARLSPAAA
jgi:ABC-2 type transport system permease protein